MELITAGNPNTKTLESVLYVAQKHYNQKLTKVLFLDTEGSNTDESGNSIDAMRNALVKQAVSPTVQIAQQFIPRKELAAELPGILSSELHGRNPDDIVIDLTNGSKTISSLLYAAGSLLQARRLFFLTVNQAAREKSPSEFSPEDYWVEDIDPLQNIRALGQHGFFDLIYYREKITDLVPELDRSLRTLSATDIESYLNRAIENYFKGNYSESISASGQLAEQVAIVLCNKIKRRLKCDGVKASTKNFNDATTFLTKYLCEPLRTALREKIALDELQTSFTAFRNTDKLLEYLRVLRNDASHIRQVNFTKDEAKASLDAIMSLAYLLRKEQMSQ